MFGGYLLIIHFPSKFDLELVALTTCLKPSFPNTSESVLHSTQQEELTRSSVTFKFENNKGFYFLRCLTFPNLSSKTFSVDTNSTRCSNSDTMDKRPFGFSFLLTCLFLSIIFFTFFYLSIIVLEYDRSEYTTH